MLGAPLYLNTKLFETATSLFDLDGWLKWLAGLSLLESVVLVAGWPQVLKHNYGLCLVSRLGSHSSAATNFVDKCNYLGWMLASPPLTLTYSWINKELLQLPTLPVKRS